MHHNNVLQLARALERNYSWYLEGQLFTAIDHKPASLITLAVMESGHRFEFTHSGKIMAWDGHSDIFITPHGAVKDFYGLSNTEVRKMFRAPDPLTPSWHLPRRPTVNEALVMLQVAAETGEIIWPEIGAPVTGLPKTAITAS